MIAVVRAAAGGALVAAILTATACERTVVEPFDPYAVFVRDDHFDPATIVVPPTGTLVWNWAGHRAHSVTWVDADLEDAPVQFRGVLQLDMPDTPGEYNYYCSVHGSPTEGMRGTVRVE